MSLPTNAALPAVDARRMALAHLTGKRIVEMVDEDLKPSDILTKEAFENAILSKCGCRWFDQCGCPPAGPCRSRGC